MLSSSSGPISTRSWYFRLDMLSSSSGPISKRKYQLRVDIGPLDEESIVENPRVVRTDLLPRTVEGHWLKVAAVSDRFEVSPMGRWLFLPTTGAAWACK